MTDKREQYDCRAEFFLNRMKLDCLTTRVTNNMTDNLSYFVAVTIRHSLGKLSFGKVASIACPNIIFSDPTVV